MLLKVNGYMKIKTWKMKNPMIEPYLFHIITLLVYLESVNIQLLT